jgi:hypothetical protein
MKVEMQLCLTYGCGREAQCQGFCLMCWSKLNDLVERGEKTWEQLRKESTGPWNKKKGRKSRRQKIMDGICIRKGCMQSSVTNGVCEHHLRSYREQIGCRLTTWDKLIASKIILPNKVERKTSQKKGSGLKCITEGCDRESISRGVCGTCYEMYRHRVSKEYCTWDALVAEGKILPASKRGKKPKPPDPWKGARESFDSACL